MADPVEHAGSARAAELAHAGDNAGADAKTKEIGSRNRREETGSPESRLQDVAKRAGEASRKSIGRIKSSNSWRYHSLTGGIPMFAENEVISFLDGPFLAKYHCVIAGSIFSWNPDSQQLSVLLEDDDAIAEACEHYLTLQGRNFPLITELVDFALKNDWPGWDKIKPQFDGTDDDEGGAIFFW